MPLIGFQMAHKSGGNSDPLSQLLLGQVESASAFPNHFTEGAGCHGYLL
jgi:hypothetical protein